MLLLSALPCPFCATKQLLLTAVMLLLCDSILHVLQDVAIAYGYNNVGLSVPPTVTVGKELPLNQLVELLRLECAMCGFSEILTWALCSRAENFDYLRRQDDGKTAVSIGNPATAEFEVCRTSLLQGEALSDCHQHVASCTLVTLLYTSAVDQKVVHAMVCNALSTSSTLDDVAAQ